MASAYALRPLERTAATQSLKEGFRVQLSDKELRNLGLVNGDLIRISSTRGFHGFATAWLAKQTNPGNKPIAKVPDLLRDTYGHLTLTDSIFIEKATDAWKPLDFVAVTCAQMPEALSKYPTRENLTFWISNALSRIGPFRRA